MFTGRATVKIFLYVKKRSPEPAMGTDATIFSHKSGTMQFAAVSFWTQRFFKLVTMATEAGS